MRASTVMIVSSDRRRGLPCLTDAGREAGALGDIRESRSGADTGGKWAERRSGGRCGEYLPRPGAVTGVTVDGSGPSASQAPG